MTRKMTWVALVVALALAVGQTSFAQAAPLQQATTTDVTINSITEVTDPTTLVTTYEVNVTYAGGFTTTLTLTAEQAASTTPALVTCDATFTTCTINTAVVDTTVAIDSTVTTDPCAAPADGSQPVGEALQGFFCGSQGVSYDTIMGWQTGGYGFGVIAQALFMAQALGGDPTLAAAILAAKTSGDYSVLETTLQGLGYDTSTVKNWNWGQVKKLVMSEEVKSMTNLGAVMSGRATPATTTTTTTTTTSAPDTSTKPGNGNGKAKGQNGGGNGNNGNGNGNNGNNGNANGKNKGN